MATHVHVIKVCTTGPIPEKDEIIEVVIVRLNIQTYEQVIVFNKVIKPSFSYTGNEVDITAEDINKAESLSAYHDQIQDLINQYPLATCSDVDFIFITAAGFMLNRTICDIKEVLNMHYNTAQCAIHTATVLSEMIEQYSILVL